MSNTKQIDISRLSEYEYYADNLLYIQTGKGLIPFQFRKRFVQKKINDKWNEIAATGRPVMIIVLKARRHGVSTYVQSRMFHGCHTLPHRQGITIAADDEGCRYIHSMSQTYYEFLPKALKPTLKQKSISKMVFDLPKTQLDKYGPIGLKSSMKTVACNAHAGLGTGNHFIHFSEYAMYRNAEDVRKAVIPTAFQEPGTFIIIESTANGMTGNGEAFYNEWMNAKENKSAFTPLFYSWLDHEDYTLKFSSFKERQGLIHNLDDEEKELSDKLGATPEQLLWRREQIKKIGYGGQDAKSGLEAFHEQYPSSDEEAFIVSGNSVFDRIKLREYKRACQPAPMRVRLDTGELVEHPDGELKIWDKPKRGEQYVIGIDPASGEPGATDFGCMQVLRVLNKEKTGLVAEQVAEWHGKRDAELLGYMATRLGAYYNEAMLAPEIFGYGHAVLTSIQREDYWNIVKRRQMSSLTRKVTDKLGWKTDPTSKPLLLTLGRYCINNEMVVLNSEALVDEMIIFVRDADGAGACAYGRGKDDRVMAYLIALKVIEEEFSDGAFGNAGILDPVPDIKNKEIRIDSPLYEDDFWKKRKSSTKDWMDL